MNTILMAALLMQVEVSDQPVVYAVSDLRPGVLFAVEGYGLSRATIRVNGRAVDVRRSTDTQALAIAPPDLDGSVAIVQVHESRVEAPVGRERGGAYANVTVLPSEDGSTAAVRVESDREGRRVDVLILAGDTLWRRGSTPFETVVPLGSDLVVQAEDAPVRTLTAIPEESGFWAAPAGGFGAFGGPFDAIDPAPVFGLRFGYRVSRTFSLVAEFASFSSEVETTETILVPQMDELNPFAEQIVKDTDRLDGYALLAGPQIALWSWPSGEIFVAALAGATWLRGGGDLDDVYFTFAPSAGARFRLGRGVELWVEGRTPLYAVNGDDRLAWAVWGLAGIEIRF